MNRSKVAGSSNDLLAGKICVVLPARGGSKRIPKKNIREFLGTPIINLVLQTLEEAEFTKDIFVSTESHEVASFAKHNSSVRIHMRPLHLASDYSTTLDVIQEFIEVKQLNDNDTLICVYPTTVFLRIDFVKRALELLEDTPEKLIFPAMKFSSSTQREMKIIDGKGGICLVNPEYANDLTQSFENTYYDSSTFYVAKISTWRKLSSLYEKSRAFFVHHLTSLDINTLEEWNEAEIIFESGIAQKFGYISP